MGKGQGEEWQATGLVAAAHPDPQRRLQVPVSAADLTEPSPAGRKGGAEKTRSSLRTGPQRRSRMSLLKRLERYVSAIFKLGRTEALAKQARKRIDATEIRLDTVERRQDEVTGAAHDLSGDVSRVWESISQLERAHDAHSARFDTEYEKVKAGDAALARTLSDMTRRLDNLLLGRDRPVRSGDPAAATAVLPQSEGFDVFRDSFYHRLENRYRGSVDEISNRLRIYLPDVEAAVIRTGGKPVLDLGCGRGEWLGLLGEAGIDSFGVDTNPVQIEAAREQGLDVRLGDAVAALAGMEDNALSVLTAHHVVEHLPFDTVAWITREAMRVLAPGGLLLYETPHTRNVLVGATTFHTDPTHLKPMPEQVLGVLFETAGFHPIEIRALHPHERFDEFLAKPDFNNELAFLMFGPQDLAVLGLKPDGD